jgi:hypothetical protein
MFGHLNYDEDTPGSEQWVIPAATGESSRRRFPLNQTATRGSTGQSLSPTEWTEYVGSGLGYLNVCPPNAQR